ncbi:MAG: hypothetical protein ACD_44C00429G0001 [uncultured bacterium]|nr:MAG: hypothetical protein ACD_44C00429G0001 [uncultured bacterium]
MIQTHLPIFPEGVTNITADLAFKKEQGIITYFNFSMPVFTHAEEEIETFRMITSQFCVNGYVKQTDIIRTFGVTKISVKRAVKLYREKGPRGFYEPRNTRGAAVLTGPVLKEIQQDLDQGLTVFEIAKNRALKSNTINKAIRANRLHKPLKKNI